MPRFYFDVHDGETFLKDDGGMDLADMDAAHAEAVKALPPVIEDAEPGEDLRDFFVCVRDEVGKAVLKVTLSLKVERPSS